MILRFDSDSIEIALRFWSWLIYLASALGIYILVEQPLNSMLYWVSSLSMTFIEIGARRIVSYNGAFGATSMKALEFYTTIPSGSIHMIIGSFKKSKERLATAERKPLMISTKKASKGKSTTGWNKGSWVSGTKAQKESEVYPDEFCAAWSEMVEKLITRYSAA